MFRSTWLAALLSLAVPVSTAAASDDAGVHKKRFVFPSAKRKKQREAPAVPPLATVQPIVVAPEEPAAIEAPAEEAPHGGIWEWVDAMDGEIPSAEQVQGIAESTEAHVAEKELIDDLSGSPPPVAFYADPAAALAQHPLFLDQVDPREFDIPVEVNASVEKWVTYFTGPGRKYYARWLARSSRYRPMMLRQLRAEGLPEDLVYLSMIESGYNAHAYSHAAAAGLWQFIPSTGTLYDLRIDWWVDERRDPEQSLGAAMAFLSELHGMFGDWRLAWAGYNTGPGRVRRATSKAGSKDFWTLAAGTYLHPETDNYVPKIMAAAIIGKHPERYGFTDVPYQDELVYDIASVDGSVELEVIARCAGTTVDVIKELNPALRRYATPPEGYDVRVPVGTRDTFLAALAEVPASKRVTVVYHKVKRGETLSKIGARYSTSVAAISAANNLQNVDRISVGMSLRIPRGGSAVAVAPKAPTSRTRTKAAARPTVHVVRRGETLSAIAGRYGVTATQLRAWNRLRDASHIEVGQRIALSGGSGTAETPKSPRSTAVTHVVQRGETLTAIAKRYQVSAGDLQAWNQIRNASQINVGQRLQVHAGSGGTASAWSHYTVRAGDNLHKIATRHGCTVSQLQQWNGIRGSTIHPGQKLKLQKG